MRLVILLAGLAFLPALLSAQFSTPFFSTFDAERGETLTPARDGGLWVGGRKDDRVLLLKLNTGGTILEQHSVGFQGAGLDNEHLVDLSEDSDGMLVGCGFFENDNAGRGFVFRYNPLTRQMLWANIVHSNRNVLFGITELGPGGDFVLYGNPHFAGGDDAELVQLRRQTGQIANGKALRFGFGPSDNLTQLVYHEGALYGCGRFTGTEPSPFARMRNAVCKIDTATLEPLWVRLGPLPTSSSGRFYGRDLLLDNGAILSTFSGDHTGPALTLSRVYLQKNDLAGNLLWTRNYLMPEFTGEFAEDLIALPDGYMLYGFDLLTDTSRLFLLKTDKNGFPLAAVKIDIDFNDQFSEVPARSKLLRLGDALFLTGLSENALGQTQAILAKTDLNGLVDDTCSFFSPTPVTSSLLDFASAQPITPVFSLSPATLETAAVDVIEPDVNFSRQCGACSGQPELGPNRLVCAGQTLTLDAGAGFVSYQWFNGPAAQTYTVGTSGMYTVAVTNTCGQTLHDSVQVTLLPPATDSVVLHFYPGDTVFVAGTAYSASAILVEHLTTAAGCDSTVTYILQQIITNLAAQCPANLHLTPLPNQTSLQVSYPLPTAQTDCPNPAITYTLLQGLPPGSLFPAGVTAVCYEAANLCGIRDTCCFTVTVQASAPPEPACDIKTPPGCLRYELLDIRYDATSQRRYRVRVTNTCASPLAWAAVQLPYGAAAVAPTEGVTYTTSGGNTYTVRNPNASPFYSIRFKPSSGGLKNGESDIFEYTLPQQAVPVYIHVAAKLTDGSGSETHLNTFNCPVLPDSTVQNRISEQDFEAEYPPTAALLLRPNPTTGQLFVDLEPWANQFITLRVFTAQGQLSLERGLMADATWLELELPAGIADGLYFLTVQPEKGEGQATRFVLERDHRR